MKYYQSIVNAKEAANKLVAVLVDPEDFHPEMAASFLRKLPVDASHIFVGGSTASTKETQAAVLALKKFTSKPIFLFPGDHVQLTDEADAVLFLSLLSGRNPEYLVEQQLKSVRMLKHSSLEIIPTAYILVDGGNESAVARVSQTNPIAQTDKSTIIDTALAGQYMGAKLVYLEAGSGALVPVHPEIISEVKSAINIPLLVGGGIRTETQKQAAFQAGADVVVMGTIFEN